MPTQFRDKQGALWIATVFGSSPVGGARVGPPPIDVGKMDIAQIKMEKHGTAEWLFATLRLCRWQNATEAELRDALAQALAQRDEL